MATLSTAEAHPRYVPPEFALRRRLDGSEAAGFQGDPDQLQLIFTKGWNRSDWNYALTVHLAESESPLFGTEHKEGTSLDLGIADVSAVYHDGIWSYDAARAEGAADPASGLRWSTGVHSVTARQGNRSYAIRASRDVGTEELVKSLKTLLGR